MNIPDDTCPSCRQSVEDIPFYRCKDVPVNSVVLCRTPEEAAAMNRGDISLVHCRVCGFIFNAEFDIQKCVYNKEYEESQAHSNVFNAFNRDLAARLLHTYRLRGKTILEIGCGKGDFLHILCSMGDNRGIGYDPAFVANRSQAGLHENVTIYDQFFPEKYDGPQPDCIICRMTLEHITDVHDFLVQIRQAIAAGRKPLIFLQVPDTRMLLDQKRFWDIYYEHCSYFTRDSLTRLLERTGFEVISTALEYDGQYLMVEAVPTENHSTGTVKTNRLNIDDTPIKQFTTAIEKDIHAWQNLVRNWNTGNKRVVLWGGGSKAVAFLTSLKISAEISSVVDINPHKQGHYLPGSGHPVISPEELAACKSDIILAMNPVYLDEIKNRLGLLNIDCQLLPLSSETIETGSLS